MQNRPILFVNQITDYLFVIAIEVMRILKAVERPLARGTVGVRSAIHIDIHPVRQHFEGWVLLPILSGPATTVSLPFDRVLADDDLAGSRAHVKGLGKAGILTDSEVCALIDALDMVEEEFTTGVFVFAAGDEDVHTAIERRVTELAATSAPSCTRAQPQRPGRHRPAAVVPPLARRGGDEIMALQDVLAQRARRGGRRLPPRVHPHAAGAAGAAGPPPAGARLGARRPLTSTASSPPSTGSTRRRSARALAGSSLPLDPDYVAAELGFHGRFENSARRGLRPRLRRRVALRPGPARGAPARDGRGDRAVVDRGVRLLHARRRVRHGQLDAAAEEEPRRGRAGPGQVRSARSGTSPRCWSRSRACRSPTTATCRRTRSRFSTRCGRSRVRSSRCAVSTRRRPGTRTACRRPPTVRRRRAIDLAELLVEQGMPFRQAHALIGGLVRESLERHVPLVELVAAHPELGETAIELLEPGVAVTRRRTPGGAGPGPVVEQSERFARRREVDRTRLAQWRPPAPGLPRRRPPASARCPATGGIGCVRRSTTADAATRGFNAARVNGS